ncbi:MAG: DNA-3-methyladenine glycosylase [Phycisphaerales bacterium]|jgi:DNA-3-methyladenine glycosylase
MPRLSRSNYALPADELAPALLGCLLVRELESTDGTTVRLTGIIVETEAYLAPEDQASHARNHHRSPRVEPMYARPGVSFVYLTRGVHHLFNVSCDREGSAHAVLIRALEPISGLGHMHPNRVAGALAARRSLRSGKGRPPPVFKPRDLCSGPSKLCQSLLIGPPHNAIDLTQPAAQPAGQGRLWIQTAPQAPHPGARRFDTVRDARIGVDSVGKPWAQTKLRWSVRGNPNVSAQPKT